MGTKQLISEQGWVDDMVLKLVNISTRSGSKIPDLITALRNSQTIDEKSNNLLRLINQSKKEQNKEILNVIKSALKETSELVYKQMIRNINNPKLSNVITKLKSEGKTEDEIVDILMGRLQLVSTNDSLADDLLADEYAKRMRKKVKEVYQGPKSEKQVSKVSSNGSILQRVKFYIDRYANENVQTIRRVTSRIFNSQEKLNNEFMELAARAAEASAKQKKTDYFLKKMTDIMIAKNKSFNDDIGEMLNSIIESIDDKEIKKILTKYKNDYSGRWAALASKINKKNEINLLDSIKEPFMAYKRLIWPFGKNKEGFKSWISRAINFITQLSPYTFEETVDKLIKNGVKNTVAKRMASSYFIQTVIIPFLKGLVLTIGGVVLEVWEFVNNKLGGDYENPYGLNNENNDWIKVLFSNVKDMLPSTYQWLMPFGTLIDDVIIGLISANKFRAEDYLTDQQIQDSSEVKRILNSDTSSTNSTQTNSQNQNQTGTTTVNKPKEPPLDPRFKDPFK